MSSAHSTYEAAIVTAQANHATRIAGVELTHQSALTAALVAAGVTGNNPGAVSASNYPAYASAVASADATKAASIASSLAKLASDHDNALAALRTSLGLSSGSESFLVGYPG